MVVHVRAEPRYDTCLKGSIKYIGYFEAGLLKNSSKLERSMAKTMDRSQNTRMVIGKLT